jgi:hypothetical protein
MGGGGKDIRRHPRNFGGADFNQVKTQMKAAKEKVRIMCLTSMCVSDFFFLQAWWQQNKCEKR